MVLCNDGVTMYVSLSSELEKLMTSLVMALVMSF